MAVSAVLGGALVIAAFIFWRPETSAPTTDSPIASSTLQNGTGRELEVVAEDLEVPWEIAFLPEGGMLVTDDEGLAVRAREFSSLGYRMRADQPRIDPATLKSPTFERHHTLGWNYRMNDLTAAEGLRQLEHAGKLLDLRRACAAMYRQAHAGCDWLTPQHVPEGWAHDWWTYAVACDTPMRARAVSAAMVGHGGERPYAAWRLTYQEPAFRHLASDGTCPVAESLQPRLLQFQTNGLASAKRNAEALRGAIGGFA